MKYNEMKSIIEEKEFDVNKWSEELERFAIDAYKEWQRNYLKLETETC